MGLFDQLAGQVLGGVLGGQQAGGQGNPLLQMVAGMLQQQGGLGALLAKFQQAGLAEQAASWVGTGANLPVSADQIRAALGEDTVRQWAGEIGASPEQTSASLAEVLPQMVDRFTPAGRVEEGDALQDILAKLAGGLFK